MKDSAQKFSQIYAVTLFHLHSTFTNIFLALEHVSHAANFVIQ
jgi:hypothetical protein